MDGQQKLERINERMRRYRQWVKEEQRHDIMDNLSCKHTRNVQGLNS